jgi:16S rRNA (guanine527-N7)-methyltransferase
MRRVAPGATLREAEAVSPDVGVTALSRPQLPTDAASLTPMGPAFDAALDDGLGELGLLDDAAASAVARRSYEVHARLLREWGAAINLTAIRDPAEVARRHVCDSLSAVSVLRQRLTAGATLLDLGSGGGYPGLPLGAALPLGRVGLVDATSKKARFLAVAARAVVTTLEAGRRGTDVPTPRIEAIHERAEDLADDGGERAGADVVTARAVGALAEVIEIGLPLLREGGILVAWKREEERAGLGAELRDAGSIIRACGGGHLEVVVVSARSLPGHRLVVVPKSRPTPAAFPRPASVRRRRRA